MSAHKDVSMVNAFRMEFVNVTTDGLAMTVVKLFVFQVVSMELVSVQILVHVSKVTMELYVIRLYVVTLMSSFQKNVTALLDVMINVNVSEDYLLSIHQLVNLELTLTFDIGQM
jgi:hypothetical protein